MFFKNISARIFYSALIFSILFAVSAHAQTTAEDYLKLGRENYKNEKYIEAEKAFDKAVELAPDSAEAHFWRGMVQLSDEKAFAELNKAIELKPDYADAYFRRGLKKSFTDNKAAIADYDKAIKFNPQLVDAYMTRAVCYMLENRYDLAIKDYTTVIELKPDGTGYYVRGTAYLDSGDSINAIKDLTKSIELSPAYYWSYKQRAKAYRRTQKLNLAQSDEQKAARIGPPKVD